MHRWTALQLLAISWLLCVVVPCQSRAEQHLARDSTEAFRMMKNTLKKLLMVAMSIFSASVFAADGPWNGKSAAVVLTYDDALNVHLDNVIPALEKRDMHGTFYVTLNSESFRKRMSEWQVAGEKGHELGNHTLFHPCRGSVPNREWVSADYDLDRYSVQRIVDEIALSNAILEKLDGKNRRTFAYTCGETTAGNKSFIENIKPLVPGARGVANSYSSPEDIDLYNINAYGTDNDTGEELVSLARQAVSDKKLIVYLFHGVGGEHSLNVSLEAHAELLDYLQKNKKDIWTATMLDVVSYLASAPERGSVPLGD
jgi:sialate O-acetylesterase